MGIILNRHILLLVLISWCMKGFSQEIRGLNYNPMVKKSTKTLSLKSPEPQKPLTIPLPIGNIFFDDFTQYGTNIFPESTNWVDKNTTVTRSYSDSSVSYGVITFDCFDSLGKVYGPVGRVNPSDTLTSRIIDSIKKEEQYYLSFFIQGGGKADPPEEKDSIMLEFFYSDIDAWEYVWSTKGFESHTFEQIIIPIDSSRAADTSFRFRFINFTSLSKNEVIGKEGALSNADYWHMDYIQIKSAKDPDEMTLINDVAIYEPLLPIFQSYSIIPYSHIKYSAGYLRDSNAISYRTYFPEETKDIRVLRKHIYFDATNNDTLESNPSNSRGIQSTDSPFDYISHKDLFKVTFNTWSHLEQPEGTFLLKSFLTPTDNLGEQYLWNDTVSRTEVYRDFYAYDDGSAEYGFGITGADSYISAFASKFGIYHQQNTPDTLTGVYIYFNHAANNYNSNLEFQVAVWNVKNGIPGDSLFFTSEDKLYTPDTTTGFNNPTTNTNGFMRINFSDEVLVLDSFYIGIIQYTNEFLNVGYDVSLNSKSKSVYYSDNQWNSLTKIPNIPGGSLMIRPIFDDYIEPPSGNKSIKIPIQESIDIFPNPAQDYITLNLPESDFYSYTYRIFDILGKEIQSYKLTSNTIDISQMPSGMYVLQVQHQKTKKTYTQKLLKRGN